MHIFINCNLINTFSQLIWNLGVGFSETGKSWELDLDSLKLAKIVMDKNSYEFSSFFGHEMAPLVEGLH